MARKKRVYTYPNMKIAEKKAVSAYLYSILEDFMNGHEKMKLMNHLSPSDFVRNNMHYYAHAISAIKYCHAKLRYIKPPEAK